MHVAALAKCNLAQVLQVAHAVYVGEEARLAIIAPLDNVLSNVGKIESGMAGHGGVRAGRTPVSLRYATPSVGISREPKSESALRPRFEVNARVTRQRIAWVWSGCL